MLPNNFSSVDILNEKNKECIFDATNRILEIAEKRVVKLDEQARKG